MRDSTDIWIVCIALLGLVLAFVGLLALALGLIP